MAHNNHLFFDTLAHQPDKLESYDNLRKSLQSAFGSIETLQKEMIGTANAMFGPGFVWLVWASGVEPRAGTNRGYWSILTTYLAGTPYPEAGYRLQSKDQNTVPGFAAGDIVAAGNQYGKKDEIKDLGRGPGSLRAVTPILCVNTWQHAYLEQFGVAGKNEYLKTWWETIDWKKVESRLPAEAKNGPGQGIFGGRR